MPGLKSIDPLDRPAHIHPLMWKIMVTRVERNISQEALARRAKMGRDKLASMETGNTKMGALYDLSNLADALGMKILIVPKGA